YMKATPQNKTQRPNCAAAPRGAFVLLGLLASLALADKSMAAAVSGNISPNAIEIDGNLYPLGTAGMVDWVKDSSANTDPASLINSIATGIIPNVTGEAGGACNWYGLRIVDGIGGAEQYIVLTGIK